MHLMIQYPISNTVKHQTPVCKDFKRNYHKEFIPCTSTVPVAFKAAKSPLVMPSSTPLFTELADKFSALLPTIMSANTVPFLNAVTFTPMILEFDVSLAFWRVANISDSISIANSLNSLELSFA